MIIFQENLLILRMGKNAAIIIPIRITYLIIRVLILQDTRSYPRLSTTWTTNKYNTCMYIMSMYYMYVPSTVLLS